MSSADAIRLCRGTAAQRASATSITPPAGVPAVESDTGLLYIGDGAKTWAAMGVGDTIALDPSRMRTPANLSTLNSGTVADNDTVLIWDTSSSTWKAIAKSDLGGAGGGSGGILSETYPDTTRTNSTTELDLVDYTIPGGTLTTNGQAVTAVAEGLVLNNTGAIRYLYINNLLAGTLSLQDSSTSFSASTSWRAFKMTTRAVRVSATSGLCVCEFVLSSPGGSSTVLGGDMTSNVSFNTLAWGIVVDAGINWASDVALKTQLKMTDAAANYTINHKLTRIYR